MRSDTARLYGSIVALALCLARPSAVEVIDRVVAVVNGSVITLSDVEAARRFGLIEVAPGDLRAAVDRMIDRRLALVEVERYAPPDPPAARIDEAVAASRAMFGSDDAFDTALVETGLTLGQLRRHIRDVLRLRSYEQQRFGSAVQPTEDEARAFFRANQERFRRAGAIPEYEDVRGEVRATLVGATRAQAIRDWLDGLRRRAEINILPIAGR